MAKTYRNGYQIDDLREAVAELEDQFEGLQVSLAWTQKYQTGVPVGRYTVTFGQTQHGEHPVTGFPLALAQAIRARLGDPQDDVTNDLLNNVEHCPVN